MHGNLQQIAECRKEFVETVYQALYQAPELNEDNRLLHIYFQFTDESEWVRLQLAAEIHQVYKERMLIHIPGSYIDYDPQYVPIGVRVTYYHNNN